MPPTPQLLTRYLSGIPHLAGRVAPATYEQYQLEVHRYLEFCQWERAKILDAATFRAWRTHLVDVEELAAPTINRKLAALKTVVKLTVTHERLDPAIAYQFAQVELVSELALKHRQRPNSRLRLTKDQVRRIWLAPDPSTLAGARTRAMIAVLATSGCRISEVIGLRQDQLHKGTLDIVGKNHLHPRSAPLSQLASLQVQSWLSRRAQKGINVERIFTSLEAGGRLPTPLPMTRYSAYQAFKLAAKKAGIPDAKPHDMRRYVCSEIARRYNPYVAQQVLGHRNPETTAEYILDELEMEGLSEDLL
jgi:integrase